MFELNTLIFFNTSCYQFKSNIIDLYYMFILYYIIIIKTEILIILLASRVLSAGRYYSTGLLNI